MNNELKIICKDKELMPIKKHTNDAGFDLISPYSVTLSNNNSVTKLDMQISIAIPKGNMGLIVPRSGLGTRGLKIANTVGVIDSDYRGNIILNLINTDRIRIKIERGDRIAQLIIVPITLCDLKLVDNLDKTVRGSGGFGSTGIKKSEIKGETVGKTVRKATRK